MTFANTYEFTIVKDWWGVNELPLCFKINGSRMGSDKCLNFYMLHFNIGILDFLVHIPLQTFDNVFV